MHRGKTRAPTVRTSPIVIISAKKEDEKDAHARSRRASCDRRKTLGKRESETDIYSLDSRREMRFASGLSPSSRNGFFPFFSIEFRPIERIGSNRIESGGEEGENGRDGMG